MRPIDADALQRRICGAQCGCEYEDCGNEGDCLFDHFIFHARTLDVAPVAHGEWVLETHSFYVDTWDESTELSVYITATCDKCGRRHPDSSEVYSITLFAPEDADEDFSFDREEEEKKALVRFGQQAYSFAHYCPNCGAKMDKEDTDD